MSLFSPTWFGSHLMCVCLLVLNRQRSICSSGTWITTTTAVVAAATVYHGTRIYNHDGCYSVFGNWGCCSRIVLALIPPGSTINCGGIIWVALFVEALEGWLCERGWEIRLFLITPAVLVLVGCRVQFMLGRDQRGQGGGLLRPVTTFFLSVTPVFTFLVY